MSDFDKEAEREKLRKKFARDEQKRASTQRMSELLLKGATMTNKHCGNCSDPLFRYNDQTFCPSCEAAADPQTDADADTETRTQPTTTGTQTEPNDTARQTDSQTAAESGQSQQDATAESFADHPRQPDTHSTSDQSAASSTQRSVDNQERRRIRRWLPKMEDSLQLERPWNEHSHALCNAQKIRKIHGGRVNCWLRPERLQQRFRS